MEYSHPTGRVAFTVWADPAKLQAFGVFFAAVSKHLGDAPLPHGPLFGVSDFGAFHRLVGAAGFLHSAVSEVPIAWRMPSIDPFLAGFGDWAQMDAWPTDRRAAIEADVRDAARVYGTDGIFTMPNPVILVTAVK